jgi:probable phosphoglycerate mutase
MMKTIITIQHTQAVHHTNGMVGSWTDWELTELGKQYAENIGQKPGAELAGKPCKIYCSDLTRTKQTAEPVARILGLPVEYRQELREINLGSACGKSWQWFNKNSTPLTSIHTRPIPGGESGFDVWNRLNSFCDEIIASSDELIIIVSHGMALETWYAVWLKWDIEMFERCDFMNAAGGVSFMRENDDGKRVLMRLNDMSYSGRDVRLV